ncbi:hypothetical protein N665_0011s0006 [Sinapis alba]|nr:hypothetical protein N665_0011s0006 [Sinapis alba]
MTKKSDHVDLMLLSTRRGTFIRDPDSIRDPIRIRSENPDIRRGRIRIRIDPNPDPDIRRILQFLGGYPTPRYPRTPDPDKDSKIMDPPDKDPDPDTSKYPGYPIRSMPTFH